MQFVAEVHFNIEIYHYVPLQVLSQRVADSLKQVKDEALSSTIEFIEKLNKVFDLLNIRYEYEGEHGRNLNKVPFRKQDDERFEVINPLPLYVIQPQLIICL
jgi:hypothetical protein